MTSTTATATATTTLPYQTLSLALSPDYLEEYYPFFSALHGASCLNYLPITSSSGCTAVQSAFAPCESSYVPLYTSLHSSMSTQTGEAAVSSMSLAANEIFREYVVCKCGSGVLEPWLYGWEGVCAEECGEEGEQGEENRQGLEKVHSAFSSLCAVVGVEAAATATATATTTTTGTGGGGGEDESPTGTGSAPGEAAEGEETTAAAADGGDAESAVAGRVGVSTTGAMLGGLVGLCVFL
ncbi:hypothetical protein MKZ38_008488 [Zalerion maritima]|uniref:Uncharacterized protein n=1 Tax=Zalerion maritima TaxID=339359 RepID=A0AAD5RUA9_9PEZI|nr:hypothetical protein MKZ38_008488 [Zalerion maritima]